MAAVIDTDRDYSLREAAKLIPSARGKSLHFSTLHRWCQKGAVRAKRIGQMWLIPGDEVERIRRGEPNSTQLPSPGRSAAQKRAAVAAAERKAREMGLLPQGG